MADTITTGTRVVLQEYGSPVEVPRSRLDIDALTDANAHWIRQLGLSGPPIRLVSETATSYLLRAEAVTGIVRIGNVDFEVAPKFLDERSVDWRSALWQILICVSGGGVDLQRTSGRVSDELLIPDFLAEIFLDSFTRGTSRGLPRAYRQVRTEGTVLRGTFDRSRLASWITAPWQIPAISDDLSEHTPLARLLRWTAATLANTVSLSSRAKSLRAVSSSLSGIDRTPPNSLEAVRIQVGLQHRALEPARMVGLLLLRGSSFTYGEGNEELSGFLWNSDVVYENFVFWLCRKAGLERSLTVDKRVESFGEVLCGPAQTLQTTPDVVFRDRFGNVRAVVDAKYKIFGGRPKAADSYQILTAAHVLGCSRVALVYPGFSGFSRTTWKVRSKLGGDAIILSALPLDLIQMSQKQGVETLINGITNWLDLPLSE